MHACMRAHCVPFARCSTRCSSAISMIFARVLVRVHRCKHTTHTGSCLENCIPIPCVVPCLIYHHQEQVCILQVFAATRTRRDDDFIIAFIIYTHICMRRAYNKSGQLYCVQKAVIGGFIEPGYALRWFVHLKERRANAHYTIYIWPTTQRYILAIMFFFFFCNWTNKARFVV